MLLRAKVTCPVSPQGDAASLKGDVRRLVTALAQAHEEAAASVATLARIDAVKGRMQAAHDTLRGAPAAVFLPHHLGLNWQSVMNTATAPLNMAAAIGGCALLYASCQPICRRAALRTSQRAAVRSRAP